MQIVYFGDNLHELSKTIFWEKIRKNIINLSSAECTQSRILSEALDQAMTNGPISLGGSKEQQ